MSSVFVQLKHIHHSSYTINNYFISSQAQENWLTCGQLHPHLSEGKEVLLAVCTKEGFLLCAVGGLVLAELIREGEALVTLIASKDCIGLQNDEKKMCCKGVINHKSKLDSAVL